MKITTLIFFSILGIISALGQHTIIDYLDLKDQKITRYIQSEINCSDSIVDLANGYFEENNPDIILRQAAVFNNDDGSKLLGVTACEYDFVCYYFYTEFFEITTNAEQLSIKKVDSILPELSIKEFIEGTKAAEAVKKLIKQIKPGYLAEGFTEADVLKEVYHIKYIIPQFGTSITATLSVCDYLPTNEVEVSNEIWGSIEKDFRTISLKYDKALKRFTK